MSTENKRCPDCGHTNPNSANFCGWCCNEFQNSQNKTALAVRSNNQPVVRRQNYQIAAYSNDKPLANVGRELEIMRSQFIQIRDMLQRGSIFWPIVGRRMYQRELKKRIEATVTRLEQFWQDVYIRYQEQQAWYLLRRQQQQYDHEYRRAEFGIQQELLDEEIQRRFQRLAMAIDAIIYLFITQGRFSELKDEVQWELAVDYIRQAERLALSVSVDDEESHNDLDYLEEDY